MELSLGQIYARSFKAVRENLLIYLMLFLWGLAQGLLLVGFITVGSLIWATISVASAFDPESSLNLFSTALIFLFTLIVFVGIMSAATKAGLLSFAVAIRHGSKPTALDFLRGMLRYTLPIFAGSIVVGMLIAIPGLIFLLVLRSSIDRSLIEIFSTGWNYPHAIAYMMYIWRAMMIAAAFNILLAFWVTPWEERIVLYGETVSESLVKSFSFVFSRRYFARVAGLVIINVAIAQVIIIVTNYGPFMQGLPSGLEIAWINAVIHASGSTLTSFLQFVFMPFLAWTQMFLLPIRSAPASETLIGEPGGPLVSVSPDNFPGTPG